MRQAAREAFRNGTLDVHHVPQEDDPAEPDVINIGGDDEEGNGDHLDVDALPKPARREPVAEPAKPRALALIPDLSALLTDLGYEQYGAALAGAGVCCMAELAATSKSELQKVGVLAGHANSLLHRAHRPFDAQPAPKRSKASHALA